MEVTASGLPRQRRQELQALVERLRGVWSGALTVGRTAAVVVDAAGPAAVDWQAPKLAVARQHGIAVVSSEWLEDSAQHGFLLATRAYQLSPPAPGRRSSAASTSLAGAAPPANPATTTATARPAEEQLAPLLAPPLLQLRQPHEQHMIQQQRRQADGSPEVERLREARSPLAPLQAPAFLERSPAAASPAAPSSVGPHATVHDKLVEPLPSPAMAPDVRSSGGQRLAGLLPSPSPLPALGDEAQLLPASQAGSCGPAALLPSPADSSLSSGPAARAAGGRAAGTPTSRRDDAVTPVGAAALEGGALRSPSTDSDIVARFLSRRPCITVARGSALPRRHLAASPSPSPSPSPSSNAGTSIRSSMSSGGSSSGGGALSAAHSPAAAVADSPADDGSRWGQGGGTPQPDGATERAAGAAATRAGEAQGQGIAGGLAPTPAPIPAHWLSDSVARMPRGLAEGGLPATTLVRMGPRLQRAPGRSTLQGLAERHGGGEGGSDPPAASFYASATALPEGGAELQFVAGDASHGAVMLYDLGEGGRPVYAPVLIQTIYRLEGRGLQGSDDDAGGSGGSTGGASAGGASIGSASIAGTSTGGASSGGGGEAWMEHRYLLTKADLEERPAWAAALRGHAVGDDEVLLSAGSYHSPMHLIAGEFWLRFPGRTRRVAGRGAASPEGQERQPAFLCRKGFDAAARAVVPLRRALDGFSAPAAPA